MSGGKIIMALFICLMMISCVTVPKNCLDICMERCNPEAFVFIYQVPDGRFHAVLYYPKNNNYWDIAFNKKGAGRPQGVGVLYPCNSEFLIDIHRER